MSLLDRIEANQCVVADCRREKLPDTVTCKEHLNDLWRNRLLRLADGSLVERRTFPAREDGSWRAA